MKTDLQSILRKLEKRDTQGGGINIMFDEKGIQAVKGKDGVTPVKGKDYFTASEIKQIIEIVAERATPVKGKDYYTTGEVASMIREVQSKVKHGRDGVDGKDGVNGKDGECPDAQAVAIDAITLLESFEGDARLSATALKDFETALDKALKNPEFRIALSAEQITGIKDLLPQYPPMNAGGSGATFLKSLRDVDLSGLTKNADGKYVLGGGSSLPDQTGNNGKFLKTDGTNTSWESIPGGGDMLASTYDPANKAEQVLTVSDATDFAPALGSDDNYVTDAEKAALHSHSNKTVLDNTTASFTTAQETKLSGIEAGAEVNNISDVNATDLTDGGDTTLHKHDIYEPLLPTTPASPDTKFLNGNRQWAEIVVGSGGYAANVYMTEVTSTIVGSYKQSSSTNDAATVEKSTVVNNNTVLIQTYLFEAALGITTIDAGVWNFNFYGKVSLAAATTRYMIEVFKRASGGTETTLFTSYSNDINNTTYDWVRFQSTQPGFTVDSTDRLGHRVYATTDNNANTTVYYEVGDGNASYINTPLALRHTQLRGLNDDTNNVHVTSAEKSAITHSNRTALDNVSGVNSGDQSRDSLGLDTDDSPQFAGVNIGHATDTTLTRVSAGLIAVEGVNLLRTADIDDTPVNGETAAPISSNWAYDHTALASSDTVVGHVEIATTAETNTGTDAGRAVSPDALAGSYAGTKSLSVQIFDGATDVATGDGKAYITIPEALNGMNLIRAQATVVTAGTTNATTVMIHNKTDAQDMLSGAISIASAGTVGTVGTVNTTYDDVATNDVLRIDVDSVSTTAPKGLMVVLEFRLA